MEGASLKPRVSPCAERETGRNALAWCVLLCICVVTVSLIVFLLRFNLSLIGQTQLVVSSYHAEEIQTSELVPTG